VLTFSGWRCLVGLTTFLITAEEPPMTDSGRLFPFLEREATPVAEYVFTRTLLSPFFDALGHQASPFRLPPSYFLVINADPALLQAYVGSRYGLKGFVPTDGRSARKSTLGRLLRSRQDFLRALILPDIRILLLRRRACFMARRPVLPLPYGAWTIPVVRSPVVSPPLDPLCPCNHHDEDAASHFFSLPPRVSCPSFFSFEKGINSKDGPLDGV